MYRLTGSLYLALDCRHADSIHLIYNCNCTATPFKVHDIRLYMYIIIIEYIRYKHTYARMHAQTHHMPRRDGPCSIDEMQLHNIIMHAVRLINFLDAGDGVLCKEARIAEGCGSGGCYEEQVK